MEPEGADVSKGDFMKLPKLFLCPGCKRKPETHVCGYGWLIRCESMPWKCPYPVIAIACTRELAIQDWNRKVRAYIKRNVKEKA